MYGCENARRYLKQLPVKSKANLAEMLPSADPIALQLLERLLFFDPTTRISADDALNHPYFDDLKNINTEPMPRTDEQLNTINTIEKDPHIDIRQIIYEQALKFNKEMEVAQGQDTFSHSIAPEWEKRLCSRMNVLSLEFCESKILWYREMITEMAEQACLAMDRVCKEQEADDIRDVMAQFRKSVINGDENMVMHYQRDLEKILRVVLIRHRLDID
jgi:serine/threonine protein kinase